MDGKITQKQLAFYKLYQARKEDRGRYVPTWEFGGEIFVAELNLWGLMSYKCPTRLTDIFQENIGLLERVQIKGKSGSKYFAYRFAANVSRELIKDEKLMKLYNAINK